MDHHPTPPADPTVCEDGSSRGGSPPPPPPLQSSSPPSTWPSPVATQPPLRCPQSLRTHRSVTTTAVSGGGAAFNTDRVIYSGWMNKQGGMFLGFRRRFFELKPGGKLYYSRKDGGGEAEACGIIRLHGATVSKNYATDPAGVLEVSSPLQSRIFYLKGTREEVNRWEDVLLVTVRRLPPLFPRQDDGNTEGSTVTPRPYRASTGSTQNQYVFKSGYLQKRGKLNTAFKRRWFVLKKGRLEYYRSHTELETPRGVILVAEGSSTIVQSAHGDFPRHLQVSSVEGRVYVLATRTERDLNEWLVAIRARHDDRRLGRFHAVPSSQRPSTIAIESPPQPSQSDFGGSQSGAKKVLRTLTKITPLDAICKIGCGGPDCKHCDPCRGRSEPITSAIDGLNASWVTHNCIACTRPSTRLIEKYDIIAQFMKHGVTCVYNLQSPDEHADCGDGNIDNQWSYDPEAFIAANVSVRCYGWPDFGCPTYEHMLRMVRDMATETDRGGRVLVHCHAGHGRTGLLIACWLVFASGYTPAEAITLVRLRRAKAIQTAGQAAMIKGFATYLRKLRAIFNWEGLICLQRPTVAELAINRSLVPPTEATRLGNRHVFLDRVGGRLVELFENDATDSGPFPSTSEMVTTLKRCVDEGAWDEVAQCGDSAALVRLTLEWVHHFEPPLLHPPIVDAIKVAAKTRDPAVLTDAAWSSLEDVVELEMVRCFLTIFQHMHRRTLVRQRGGKAEEGGGNAVGKFAVGVAEAVMALSMSQCVGRDIIELGDALSDLAALDNVADFASFNLLLPPSSGPDEAFEIVELLPAGSLADKLTSADSTPAVVLRDPPSRSASSGTSSLTASFISESVEIVESGLEWGGGGVVGDAGSYEMAPMSSPDSGSDGPTEPFSTADQTPSAQDPALHLGTVPALPNGPTLQRRASESAL